jgi:hypothetical protein
MTLLAAASGSFATASTASEQKGSHQQHDITFVAYQPAVVGSVFLPTTRSSHSWTQSAIQLHRDAAVANDVRLNIAGGDMRTSPFG